MRKFIAILAALMVAAIPFASFAEGFGAQAAGKFTISDFRLTADGKDTDLSAAVLTGCIAVDGDDFAALLAVGPTDAPETLRIALKGENGSYSATLGNAEQFMPYAVTVSQSDIQMLMQIAGFDANQGQQMFEKLSTAVMNFVSSLGAPVTGEADYTFFDGQTLTAQTISYTVTPEQLAAFFTELGSAVGQEIDVSGVNTNAVVTVYNAEGNHGAFVSEVGGSTVTFEFVSDTASSKVAFRVVADENGRVAFTADGTVTPADGGMVYDMTVASDEVDGTIRVIAAAADDTHFTVDYSMDMTEKSGAKTAVSYILQVELLDAAAVAAEVNGAFAGAQEVSVLELLGGSGTEMLNAAQEILMPALQTLQQLPGVAEAIGV